MPSFTGESAIKKRRANPGKHDKKTEEDPRKRGWGKKTRHTVSREKRAWTGRKKHDN